MALVVPMAPTPLVVVGLLVPLVLVLEPLALPVQARGSAETVVAAADRRTAATVESAPLAALPVRAAELAVRERATAASAPLAGAAKSSSGPGPRNVAQ